MIFRIVSLISLVWLIWAGVNKYKRLNRPAATTETDRLETLLAPVRHQLPLSSTISFKTNLEKGRAGVLYFKTALVLAPMVVTQEAGDTVLFLSERAITDTIAHKRAVLSGSDHLFFYQLLVPDSQP